MLGKIVTANNILRGPARVLYYSSTITGTGNASTIEPTNLSDILSTLAMDGDCVSTWTDFGAVDGAVTHQRTLTIDKDRVENLNAPLRSFITDTEDIVIANFAENSLDNLQLAWELASINTDETPDVDERITPLSVPESLTSRAIAFLYAKPDGKLRCHIFWDVVFGGAASGSAYAKSPKALIPVQFNVNPSLTIVDSNGEPTMGKIIEQYAA